jgi:hypothetical protein
MMDDGEGIWSLPIPEGPVLERIKHEWFARIFIQIQYSSLPSSYYYYYQYYYYQYYYYQYYYYQYYY